MSYTKLEAGESVKNAIDSLKVYTLYIFDLGACLRGSPVFKPETANLLL